MLEIGLWEPLEQRVEVEDDDFERVTRGFQALAIKLDGYACDISATHFEIISSHGDSLTGSIYADVVRRCLAIGSPDQTNATDLAKFCSEIAAKLDQCCA